MKHVFVLIACLSAVASVGAEDRLITLDGLTADKTIRSIDADGLVRFDDDSAPVALDALRRIEPRRDGAQPLTPPQHPIRLLSSDGSILLVTQITIDGQQVRFDRPDDSTAAWPLDSVRAVVFADVPNDPRGRLVFDPLFTQTMNDTASRQDHLLVMRDGQLIVIPGALVSLDAAQATFVWNDQPRTIQRDQIYGITLAASGSPPPAPPHQVRLSDGSMLVGRIERLADGLLTLRLGEKRTLQLPWERIVRIDVRSDRLTFISDLEPLESRTEAVVTYPWPAQRDASVMGGPLQLAGVVYDKGIGVHARSVLRYALEGAYDQFAATIGLDDNSGGGGAGDCIFIVIADGKELLRQRMTSTDDPRKIVVDVRAAMVLELIVEPGENLDIADHADWADARLIRMED